MMSTALLDAPLLQTPKPWWLPFVSLFITVYGIVFQGWGMQAVVFLFWWEIILMVGSALVRAVFAMDNQPFLNTLGQKLYVVPFGVIMGGVMIMLAVAFSINAFDGTQNDGGLAQVPTQTRLMMFSYAMGLLLHYFLNGRFRSASPMGEMMVPIVHLLFLLSFLMPITMHLLPKYPQLNQARYVALAVVVVKFGVDWLFVRNKAMVKAVTDV